MNVRFPRSMFRARPVSRLSRPHGWKAIPRIEVLEDRRLLTTAINWISATSGSWDDASNWSPKTVPGPGDDVVINVPGVTVTISSNVESVNSITADDPLDISGGGLTVAANSTISDGLDMTGGSLTASGSAVSFTVSGTTTVSGASLEAEAGATISMPALTSYTSDGSDVTTTLEATGLGSSLTLAKLASVTEGAGKTARHKRRSRVLAGGTVTLLALQNNQHRHRTILEGDGTGSVLNVAALTSFEQTGGWTDSTLQASNGATVDLNNLATLSGVNFNVVATGENLVLGTVTSFNSGNITVSGGATLSLPDLTSYTSDGSDVTTTLEATGTGSSLTLVKLASVTEGAGNYAAQTQFEALAGGTVTLSALQTINTGTVILEGDGTGSVLNVAALTSFEQTGGWTDSTLQASNGGTVDLSKLATLSGVNLNVVATGENLVLGTVTSFNSGNITVSGGATLSLPDLTSYASDGSDVTTTLEATGTGSSLTLVKLASVTEGAGDYAAQTQFEALAGGTVTLSALQTINTGTVILEGDGTGSVLNVAALTSFEQTGGWTDSTLQASNGGTVDLSKLATLSGVNLNVIATGENLVLGTVTSFNSGNITVSGGATLSLPDLTSYASDGSDVTTTLEATGMGSSLILAKLASVTEGAGDYAAQTQFEALAGGTVTLSALQTINTGTVILEGDGTGSVLNVAALTSFEQTGGWTDSTLQASNGATVDLNNLATLSGVDFNVIATGENLVLDTVTSYNSGNITVSGGAILSLPDLTSYTSDGSDVTTTLEATGTGSSLTLVKLASVTEGAGDYAAQTQFEALAGGTVTLPALQTIDTGTVILEGDGTGSVLNLAALTSFVEANGWTYSTLQASNGGTVDDSSLAGLSNVNLIIEGTGENLTLGGLTSFNSGNITVSGGASLSLPGVTGYSGNASTTTLEATGTGSTLTLAKLTSVTQTANSYADQTQFEALAGGTVTLSALQTINTGTVVLESDGTGSVLNCGGADQLCGGQRLDLFDSASLQRRHGRRQQSGQSVQHEPERLGHDQSGRSDEFVQHKPDHRRHR